VKLSEASYQESPCSGSRGDSCGHNRTNRQIGMRHFAVFANAPLCNVLWFSKMWGTWAHVRAQPELCEEIIWVAASRDTPVMQCTGICEVTQTPLSHGPHISQNITATGLRLCFLIEVTPWLSDCVASLHHSMVLTLCFNTKSNLTGSDCTATHKLRTQTVRNYFT
jgi:hypothetical protein